MTEVSILLFVQIKNIFFERAKFIYSQIFKLYQISIYLQSPSEMNEHQIKRIVYSNCNIDDHTTEPLSRVCIDDKCKNKTLICSLCEQLNHKGHKTVPLKTILTKMTSECNFENAGINPLYFTNIID